MPGVHHFFRVIVWLLNLFENGEYTAFHAAAGVPSGDYRSDFPLRHQVRSPISVFEELRFAWTDRRLLLGRHTRLSCYP